MTLGLVEVALLCQRHERVDGAGGLRAVQSQVHVPGGEVQRELQKGANEVRRATEEQQRQFREQGGFIITMPV